MSGRNGLISTAELADILGQADLRLFDCTTYLEPAPEGSSQPYLAVPGRHTFEAGHIPGADFLDLQGEFSDPNTELRFMMPDVAYLEARSAGTAYPTAAGWCSTASARRCGRRGSGGCSHRSASRTPRCSTAVSTNGSSKAARSKPDRRRDIRRRHSRPNRRTDFSSTSTKRSPPPPSAAPSSSTHSARNFTRAWSPAATAGPAACPAVATCRQRHCSIPQTKAFVPLAEAEAKFKAQGITKDKRVVAYCGGGISATIDLFLLHRLGYDNLTLYDGSMGEWAKDTSLPIETG